MIASPLYRLVSGDSIFRPNLPFNKLLSASSLSSIKGKDLVSMNVPNFRNYNWIFKAKFIK